MIINMYHCHYFFLFLLVLLLVLLLLLLVLLSNENKQHSFMTPHGCGQYTEIEGLTVFLCTYEKNQANMFKMLFSFSM